MNTKLFRGLALLILSAAFVDAANNVVDGKVYLTKLVDRMMQLLSTQTSVTHDGLPMLDMVGNFSGIKVLGINLDGLVKFHSGFLVKIEDFVLNPLKYEDKTDSTRAFVQNIMTMQNVNLTYELDSDLEEYKAKASIVVWFQGLEFYVSVARDHATSVIESAVSFYNIAGGAFKMHIYNFPNNAYTQLIAKEIKTPASKTLLQDQLKESFREWKNLERFAIQASEEIAFPEICFTC